MADFSILEFGIYAFVEFATLLMLIISIIKPLPQTKDLSIVRAIYVIPGMICAAILALFGNNVLTGDITTSNTIRNLNTSEVWTEVTTESTNIMLQSDIWLTFNLMIFFVLLIYLIQQIFDLFVKAD